MGSQSQDTPSLNALRHGVLWTSSENTKCSMRLLTLWSSDHSKPEAAHHQQDGESKHLISGRHGFTLKNFSRNSWSASSQSHGKWERSTLRLRKALNPGLPLPPWMLQNKRQWLSRQTPARRKEHYSFISNVLLALSSGRRLSESLQDPSTKTWVRFWCSDGTAGIWVWKRISKTPVFSVCLLDIKYVLCLGERYLKCWG